MTSQPLTKILMVEDEPDIQSVARLALEAIGGFIVHICGSGADAIQDGPAFAPDLVLLDVMMPGMDGPTTYTALRALPNLAGTPMIFMTAKVQPQEIAQYKAMGVVDVIAKPFDPMTLSTTITAIWERWRAASAGAELRVLADEYVARIPEKLAQIEHAWAAALRGGNQADLEALYRLTHGLHGSGATFGFEALSAASAELEQALAPLHSGASPSADQRIQVARLI